MLQRAAMNEEIADGEISVQDIQQILLNEYSLKVINVSGQCSLGGVENAKPTMWNLQMYIKVIVEMSRNVQSGNTQNLKSMVIQRSFPKWSVAERRKTAAASD